MSSQHDHSGHQPPYQPHPHQPPEHGNQHAHSHASREASPVTPVISEPYPFIYSKDPWDERRFASPGSGYIPTGGTMPRVVVWLLWALVVLLVGGGLLAVIFTLLGT